MSYFGDSTNFGLPRNRGRIGSCTHVTACYCPRVIFGSDSRRVKELTRVDTWSYGAGSLVRFLRSLRITMGNIAQM